MHLQAFYRLTPRGNGKPRPAWFTRRRALQSFLATCAGAADIVYVADGGVPPELADLVSASGQVVAVRGGSAARSFRRLLRVALEIRDDALVWFAEDDYLYRPGAMPALLAVARAVPAADYFGVYTPDNSAWHARHASQPERQPPPYAVQVEGNDWRRSAASTSTFGLRAGALREDAGLLALASNAGGPWDHACVCVVQKLAPYPLRHLYADLFLGPSWASAGRVVTRPLARAVLDVAARRPRPPRLWLSPVQDLATHCEPGYLAPGFDWAELALSLDRPGGPSRGDRPGRTVLSRRTTT